MSLNRETILQRRAVKTVSIPVPEWADTTDTTSSTVLVKQLTAAEYLVMAEQEKRHPGKQYALWIVAAVTDTDGKQLFTEADIPFLSDEPIIVINRLVDAAQSLNFKKPSDLLKNSQPTPSVA